MLERIQLFFGKAFVIEREDLLGEEGQTVTEYGVVLGVLIVALGGVVFVLRDAINAFIGEVGAALSALIP